MKQTTAFALLIVAALAGCRAKPPAVAARPVKTKTVELLANNSGLRYSASIAPSTELELSFKVGGYVSAIAQVRGVDGQMRHLQGGDVVKKGTVLARIRPGDYQVKVNQAQSQEVESRAGVEAAKNQSAQAQAAVEAAKAQLVEAEAAYTRARQDFARARELFASHSITKTDYDSAKAQHDVAEAKASAAQAQVRSAIAAAKAAGAQVEAMQAKSRGAGEVVTEARIPLSDTELRAPMNCTILKREVEVGSLVAPGKAGFLIADLTSVKAVLGVPDRAVQNLELGMRLSVTTDALAGQEFPGQISAISPAADIKSRVFEVEITMPNANNLLKSGMVVSLELQGGPPTTDVLVVPVNAVVQSREHPGAYALFVVEMQSGQPVARLRTVKLGDAYGNTVAVLEGVKKGEEVITTGATLVNDGDPIQVIP